MNLGGRWSSSTILFSQSGSFFIAYICQLLQLQHIQYEEDADSFFPQFKSFAEFTFKFKLKKHKKLLSVKLLVLAIILDYWQFQPFQSELKLTAATANLKDIQITTAIEPATLKLPEKLHPVIFKHSLASLAILLPQFVSILQI
ncbi:unnamed protein product [Paramecium sonneborni]|uniref:Uncharacterized protein n=1 Tax=Paramecium sonneborni TaxID=65129 RepID=A0A8S1M3P5_9CILI|nr:unnamed protein product [Paramecium sonneborni]